MSDGDLLGRIDILVRHSGPDERIERELGGFVMLGRRNTNLAGMDANLHESQCMGFVKIRVNSQRFVFRMKEFRIRSMPPSGPE